MGWVIEPGHMLYPRPASRRQHELVITGSCGDGCIVSLSHLAQLTPPPSPLSGPSRQTGLVINVEGHIAQNASGNNHACDRSLP